jgi:uncharacterized membrane protein YoaK (UPF0700 family)
MLEGMGSPPRALSFSVAAFLTAIAGFVDAVGYLLFAHIYTANMSGNSVGLGIAVAEGKWATALLHLWPVGTYVAGLLAGRLLIEIAARQRVERVASLAFSFELLLLAVVAVSRTEAPQSLPWLPIALLAIAMGVQNAILTKFSSLTLHTGFVTGTLVQMAKELAKSGTWLWDAVRARRLPFGTALRASASEKSFRLSVFLAVTWIVYVAGAIAGATGRNGSGAHSLSFPIAGLGLLIGVDLFRPLAICEEVEQA